MLIEALQEIPAEMRLTQFFLFCCVGGVGLLVDLSISLLLIHAWDVQPLCSKTISWLFGATFTFFLNTTLAFQVLSRVTRSRSFFLRAYGGYLLSQSFGGFINILIFTLIAVSLGKGFVPGFIFGAVSGLVVNYLGARKVFVRDKISS
jgi:putative flippase GtrA